MARKEALRVVIRQPRAERASRCLDQQRAEAFSPERAPRKRRACLRLQNAFSSAVALGGVQSVGVLAPA